MATEPLPPPLTPEEEKKVKRTLTILYIAMAIMAVIPFVVVFWANSKG